MTKLLTKAKVKANKSMNYLLDHCTTFRITAELVYVGKLQDPPESQHIGTAPEGGKDIAHELLAHHQEDGNFQALVLSYLSESKGGLIHCFKMNYTVYESLSNVVY